MTGLEQKPVEMTRSTHLSVAFVLLPDFTLSTFAAFVDALRIAADEADRSRQVHCRWTVLGPERVPVRSSCGVEITPWETFGDAERFDYVIVVGGLLRGHERTDRRIQAFLKKVDASGGSLVGVCTGSFALARAGLMKGYRCCVHWYHLQEFIQEFPNLEAEADVVYLVDGRRITCAGGQSSINVAVHLVEKHYGRNMALKVSSGMVVAAAGSPRQATPHPETKWFTEIENRLVQRAILLMDQEPALHRGLVGEIAARLGVSTRTLTRGFEKAFGMAPATLFRLLKVARGRWELVNTSKSIATIALDHGFSDASHFTRLFRQHYRTTPALARQNPDSISFKQTRKSRPVVQQILDGGAFSFEAIDWPADRPKRGLRPLPHRKIN